MLSESARGDSVLTKDEWTFLRERHRERVAVWADDRVSRASRAIADPVYDFLFTYYPYRPSHLMRWSPGIGVILEGCDVAKSDWPNDFSHTARGALIDPRSFPEKRVPYLQWALKYLLGIAERAPQFSCFGLHEWAMVYRIDTPRHQQVPLRLSPSEINSVVEGSDLRCTHFDAFRFFTPDAVPRNKNPLSRDATSEFDQRACIHVTMDLYKFAHKIAPWCSSELVADAFLLAADARRIDMRASPYDLRDQGYEPICIETSEGREQYIQEQRRLAAAAVPIRARLIEVYSVMNRARDLT